MNDDGLVTGAGKLDLGPECKTLLLRAGVLVVVVKAYFAPGQYLWMGYQLNKFGAQALGETAGIMRMNTQGDVEEVISLHQLEKLLRRSQIRAYAPDRQDRLDGRLPRSGQDILQIGLEIG